MSWSLWQSAEVDVDSIGSEFGNIIELAVSEDGMEVEKRPQSGSREGSPSPFSGRNLSLAGRGAEATAKYPLF